MAMQTLLMTNGEKCEQAVTRYLQILDQELGLQVSMEQVEEADAVEFEASMPGSAWALHWPLVFEEEEVQFVFEPAVKEPSAAQAQFSIATIDHYVRTAQALASNPEAAQDFLECNNPRRNRTSSGTRSKTQPG